jgi:CDP-diacylglycerol--serine O-phosphatidyltransferase
MGSISVFLSLAGFSLETAFLFILAGAVFDFLDGFMARLLNAYSAIGKELDSLADLISFGFAPAAILFRLILSSMQADISSIQTMGVEILLPLSSLIVVAFSALRLAKFNVDENQAVEFIGVPTPANALFIGSLIFLEKYSFFNFIANPYILMVLGTIMAILLVSKIPMFSLKFKSFDLKKYRYQFILLLFSIVVLFFLRGGAFVFIILFYIILNIIRMNLSKKESTVKA